MKGLKPHRFAELSPEMGSLELEALLQDIRVNGQQEPIVKYQGQILDGRHRYRCVLKLNRKPKFIAFKGTEAEALAFVKSKLMHRNLNDSQKAAVAVRYLPIFEKLAVSRMKTGGSGTSSGGSDQTTNGDSRDHAGALFGVSGRYVSDARAIFEADPKLFQEVFEGKLPVSQAKRAVQRAARSKELKKKHAAAKTANVHVKQFDLINDDCLRALKGFKAGSADLIFADPPYNMGFDYGRGAKADAVPDDKFIGWCWDWIAYAAKALAADGSIFVMMSAKYQADIHRALEANKLHWRNTIVWVETFGNYTAGNFTQCARYIHYFTRSEDDFVWHGDEILIPSDRQTKYQDKRAAAGGKVPGSVWTEFPRLVDNARERMPGFPTQLPLGLVERIVKACSDPGDLILDPFNGTGTTGHAALKNRRRYLGIDEVGKQIEFTHGRLAAVLKEME